MIFDMIRSVSVEIITSQMAKAASAQSQWTLVFLQVRIRPLHPIHNTNDVLKEK